MKTKLFFTIIGLCLVTFPGFAEEEAAKAGNMFDYVTATAITVFEGLRNVAYILGGFAIVGFTVAAIFGKISFKWLTLTCVGLYILSQGESIVLYVTGFDIKAFEAPAPIEDVPPPDENNIDGTANCSGELGSLSEKYESNGDPNAHGWDSTGGNSYGSYQIAADTGAMGEYLNYLNTSDNPDYRDIGAALTAAGGESAAKAGDQAFLDAWANSDSGDAQHDFIKDKYYDDAISQLEGRINGFDESQISPALQDVIWSTSVQHGPSGAASLFDTALGGDITNMSQEEIISRIYDERSNVDKYFASSTPAVQDSVYNRFQNEKADALATLQECTDSTISSISQRLLAMIYIPACKI